MGFMKPKPAATPVQKEAVKVQTNVDPDHGDALANARRRAANAADSQGVGSLTTSGLQTGGATRGGVSLSA
jgi:hypothetical protein